MSGFRRMKSRKTLNKWIMSYVTVLLIPIFIFGYLFFKSNSDSINNQTLNANTAEAIRISSIMDDRLNQVKKLGIQYFSSPVAQKIVEIYGNSGRDLSTDEMAYVMGDMVNQVVFNDLIVDLSLIFPRKDKALSSYGTDNLDIFFRYNNKFGGNDAGSILNRLDMYNYFTLLDETTVMIFNKEYKVIPVLQSIGFSSRPKATLIVLLDAEYLRKLISDMQVNKNNHFMILDDKNEPVVKPTVLSDFQQSEIMAVLNKQNEQSGIWTVDKNVYAYTTASKLSGWKYVYVFNGDQISLNNKDILRYISISALFAFLLGAAISAFFIFRNYVPLNRLLTHALKASQSEMIGGKNEFDVIDDSIKNLIRIKNNVEEKMKAYEPVIRKNILMQILRGSFRENSELRKQLKQAGLNADENALYGLIGMKIPGEGIFDEESGWNPNLEWLVKAIYCIESYLKHHQYEALVFDVDNQEIMTILCFHNKDEMVAAKEMEHAVAEIKRIMEEILQCHDIRIASSDIGENEAGISRAFLRVEEMLEWMAFMDSSEYKDTIGFLENRNRFYFYPMDWELQLMNGLKAGNSELVGKILHEVKTENFNHRMLSHDNIKRLNWEVIETAMKVIDELNLNVLTDEVELKRMFKLSANSEYWRMIEKIYADICREVSAIKSRHCSDPNMEIFQYVETNYNNNELSLKHLSDKFDISISSISRNFKLITGFHFLDYINNKRIVKAKELMETTEHELYLISEMVGYSNYSTFSRVFSKYTGGSPQEFKNSLLKTGYST